MLAYGLLHGPLCPGGGEEGVWGLPCGRAPLWLGMGETSISGLSCSVTGQWLYGVL